jgi:hypothetical protein
VIHFKIGYKQPTKEKRTHHHTQVDYQYQPNRHIAFAQDGESQTFKFAYHNVPLGRVYNVIANFEPFLRFQAPFTKYFGRLLKNKHFIAVFTLLQSP